MNIAYPLIPISVIIILAYFITWLFSKWGIFTLKSQRKFWNILLLLAFIINGFIGLLSVIKINYKLDIPQYDRYLKWHVILGIGMVLIALFHLSWHLKYYFSFKKKESILKDESPDSKLIPADFLKFRFLLFLLGFVAIINQVIYIREFISVLAGNELVLGVVMANWLFLTGWGAYTGRKRISHSFSLKQGFIMFVVMSILPIIMIGLLYGLKHTLYPPGTQIDLVSSTIGAFLLLFPVCFLSGYLFTAYSSLYSEAKKQNRIGKAYAIESVGSLAGGLIFSILLGRYFTTYQVLGITTGIVVCSGTWIVFSKLVSTRILFILLGILVPVFIFIFNPDLQIKKMLFPNQEIILNQSTRYGNLVVTEQAGQLNFYENNSLQFYSGNFMLNEEAVHFAMIQHENPKDILLISGGISGMIKEIKKYDVKKITYLESNPEMFKYWRNLKKENTNYREIEFIKSDIRTFLEKDKTKFDVILINLPPPVTLGYNRFYTREFFEIIRNHCNVHSVVCVNLPSTANYAEENALQVNASLWKTIGLYFRYRQLLPGEKNYFLASESVLSSNITELIEKKGIKNEYVNQNYIVDELLTQRSQVLISQFNQEVRVNQDFYPFLFIKQARHWLSHFNMGYYMLAVIPATAFLLLFFRMNRISIGLYTGGFTAASLEVTLMLAYQIFFGSIYLATAFFFTAFMGGLALGSSWNTMIPKIHALKRYYRLQFLLAVFALLLPVIIYFMNLLSGWSLIAQFLFFILVFVLAFGIGHEFFLASELQVFTYRVTSGLNYSTDLAGSAFGAFLAALVLLPIFGLIYTCMIVAALNIFSGFMAFSIRNRGKF
ncbi:hypothetical protein ACFLSA_00190 [Bacteroidota bacterium]